MTKDKQAITLKNLTKSNVWELQENDIFRLWEAAEKDSDLSENLSRYLTIVRTAFEVEEVKLDRPEIIKKYEARGMSVGFLKMEEGTKVKYAIKRISVISLLQNFLRSSTATLAVVGIPFHRASRTSSRAASTSLPPACQRIVSISQVVFTRKKWLTALKYFRFQRDSG